MQGYIIDLHPLQGYVLSPTLFNFYVTDLITAIEVLSTDIDQIEYHSRFKWPKIIAFVIINYKVSKIFSAAFKHIRTICKRV